MANERDLAKGWALEEALKQRVPDEWREWEEAAAEVRRVGRPGRRAVSDIDGPIPPSPEYIEKKTAWNAVIKAEWNLHKAFVEVMSDGQNETLILPNDAGADWRPMPSAQWLNVERLGHEKSRIRHKGEWMRVLVFPAGGALVGVWQMATDANLAKRLAGLTLAETFEKIIGDDPEIRALAKNAIDAFPSNHFFPDSSGHPDLPNIEKRICSKGTREWPVLTADWICLDGEWGLDLHPDATEADAKLIKGIAARYDLMMEPLRSGCLVGFGHFANGTRTSINKGIWSNDSYLIDFVHGDVGKYTELEEHQPCARFNSVWSAVVLIPASKVTGEKDTATKSPDEPKFTRSQQAILKAHQALFPDGVPVGRRSKARNNMINDWLIADGHDRVSYKTIQRFYTMLRQGST